MKTILKILTISVLTITMVVSLNQAQLGSVDHDNMPDFPDNELMLVQTEAMTMPGSYSVGEEKAKSRSIDLYRFSIETGLKIEDIKRSIAFQEAFTQFASNLIGKHPEKIAAIWVEPFPQMVGHIRFVGDVPDQTQSDFLSKDLGRKEPVVIGGENNTFKSQMILAQLPVEVSADGFETIYRF